MSSCRKPEIQNDLPKSSEFANHFFKQLFNRFFKNREIKFTPSGTRTHNPRVFLGQKPL